MDKAIEIMYKHAFSGGTFQQIEKDDVIILIVHPKKGSGGVVKRRGGDPLYFKTIVYLNTLTGELVVRTPSDWGELDPRELTTKLNNLGL